MRKSGNLRRINLTVTTQTWSLENRLASKVVTGGATKLYTYSDDGLRKSIFDGTNTTMFAYDEQALLLETDVAANLQVRYTGYPSIWGGLASQRRGSSSSFYGFDSQHSARILVSSAGVITDSLSFKAFGEPLATGTTVNPFGYIALFFYYTDADGNVVLGPRILVPIDGRLMPRDPIGFAGGYVNLYVYVGNEPVIGIDPSGLCKIIWANAVIECYFRPRGSNAEVGHFRKSRETRTDGCKGCRNPHNLCEQRTGWTFVLKGVYPNLQMGRFVPTTDLAGCGLANVVKGIYDTTRGYFSNIAIELIRNDPGRWRKQIPPQGPGIMVDCVVSGSIVIDTYDCDDPPPPASCPVPPPPRITPLPDPNDPTIGHQGGTPHRTGIGGTGTTYD